MTRASPRPSPSSARAALARASLALTLLPSCSALLDFGAFTARPDAGDARPPDVAPDVVLDAVADARDDVPVVPDVPDAAPPPDLAAVDARPDLLDAAADLLDVSTEAPADAPRDSADVADVPRDVADPLRPPTPLAQVGVGTHHTCARVMGGGVFCWGANDWGQLGARAGAPFTTEAERVLLPMGAAELAVGGDHACARLTDGRVFCWGRNSDGQLGDGSTTHRPEPVLVPLPRTGVWRLAAGAAHTCAVLAPEVYCWGSNARGEAGQAGGARTVTTPTLVPGVAATRLRAGARFTCAGDMTRLWCWGSNVFRELGDPMYAEADAAAPRRVPLTLTAGEVLGPLAVGAYHACVRVGATWQCWGRNDYHQIPDGAPSAQAGPIAVRAFAGAAVVAGALGQCLVRGGALTCWGYNAFGVVGDGTRLARRDPTAPPVLPDVVNDAAGEPIAAMGEHHACAATTEGLLRCWGGRMYGGLGDGVSAVFTSPVEVTALRGARDLAAGAFHTCAAITDGTGGERLVCAGYNHVGQLGSLTNAVEPTPQVVRDTTPTGSPLAAPSAPLAAGYHHACSITGGNVRCWGFNDQGQLGNGVPTTSPPFAAAASPTGPRNLTTVAAGTSHTCAASNLTIWCWGANGSGQCGTLLPQPTVLVPSIVPLVTGSERVQLAAGEAHTCVRAMNGSVFCWGANDVGQSGRAGSPSTATPGAAVTGTWRNLDGMALGARHSCVWERGGGVWCWGANNRGQTAPGMSLTATSTPLVVPRVDEVTALGAGAEHTCAATPAGVVCWGANQRGQLGIGTATDRPSTAPTMVSFSSDEAAVAQVVGGLEHTCARLAGGRVFCWGSNHVGQLATPDRFAQPTAAAGGVRWP